PKDVRVAPLDKSGLAAHQVSAVRGMLMSEKAWGSTAESFMKRLPEEQRKGGDEDGKASRNFMALINGGELSLPEIAWLDAALQRENDNRARIALANTLAGSFPDSVGELDNAANILTGAG